MLNTTSSLVVAYTIEWQVLATDPVVVCSYGTVRYGKGKVARSHPSRETTEIKGRRRGECEFWLSAIAIVIVIVIDD
jgi:hypothetical protein